MTFFKHLVAACLLLLSCYPAWAQEVIYSRYDKFDYRSDAYSVVGMCGGKLYTYVNTTEGARLDAYDESMTKTATVMLDFFPQRIYHVRFVPYPEKMMVLYQALESNKVVQYVAMLDSKGLLKNKPTVLSDTRTGIFGATRDYFSTAISENKKWILVYTAKDKKNGIEVEGKWLDDNGNLIKKSTAKFETENVPEHGEVNIANDGSVYMAAYTPIGAHDYADQYWILVLKPGATSIEAKEMPLNNRFATGGYSRIDNVNGKVYFGGFYSNSRNGRFAGFIYAVYDAASGAFANTRFIPFDNGLVADAGEKRRGYFDKYLVRQIIVKNDGGFVLIAEEQYVTTRSNFTPGFGYYSFYSPVMNSSIREYHYNDIMTVAYNKDGNREWSTFIPKQQYSQEDDGVFSSFALLNSGGTLAFLYNDYDASRSRIQLATLSPEGKIEVQPVQADGNDFPDWLPKSARQVSGRVMVVPCFQKKQICFARVQF
jgi:hypothetical protein